MTSFYVLLYPCHSYVSYNTLCLQTWVTMHFVYMLRLQCSFFTYVGYNTLFTYAAYNTPFTYVSYKTLFPTICVYLYHLHDIILEFFLYFIRAIADVLSVVSFEEQNEELLSSNCIFSDYFIIYQGFSSPRFDYLPCFIFSIIISA